MEIPTRIQRVYSFLESSLNIRLPKVADRASSDSWLYDGATFAHRKYDGFQDPYDGSWVPTRVYTACEILHEICHWLVASEDQRDFPEFALTLGVVDNYAWGTEKDGFRNSNGELVWDRVQDAQNGYLPDLEQDAQEFATQLLSVLLGQKFGVPMEYEGFGETWESYRTIKYDEMREISPKAIPLGKALFEKISREINL